MRKGLFLLLILHLTALNAFSYEINVHRVIAKKAIAASNIGLYLSNNLGIFLKDEFKGNKAEKWIEDGSDWEDDNPTMRWLNHFYDPTTGKGLNSAGFVLYGEPSLQWGKHSLNSWGETTMREIYILW